VFTNDRETVMKLMALESPAGKIRLDVVQVEFPAWGLPEGAAFFAAHHKLFLFSHLAQDAHPNCLLDVDMAINYDNLQLAKVFDQHPQIDGWVYDISDQVFPARGTQAVQDDLRLLGVDHPFPRWYGGEFLIGTPRLFAYLHEQCQGYLQSYFSLLPRLNHVGDECVVSAALNQNVQNLALADAGASGLVVRQWTGVTLHVAKPCATLKHCLFWHLPDAKTTLSRFHKHGSLDTLYKDVRRLAVFRRATALPRTLFRRILSRPHAVSVPGLEKVGDAR
jgi:hypothetical protein